MKNNKFEIEFYKKLVEQKPDYIEAIISLANAYTKEGEYKKGLELDKRLSKLKPADPIVFYNLACSYSILKQYSNAIKSLDKAIELGYDDVEYMLNDPDLDNIKKRQAFRNLLKKYFKTSSP